MLKTDNQLYGWVEKVEELIARHTVKQPDVENGKAGEVSKGWIFELILMISSLHKRDNGDGCLWHGYHIGSVLLSWWFRTAYAKTCDPRRSEKEREQALSNIGHGVKNLLDVFEYTVQDEDRAIYKQEWQPIFDDQEEKVA